MKKILFAIIALTPAVAFGASMSSYPSKTTPASADKVPISDSAAGNATKNITVGSIWDNIPGTSLSATAPLSLNQSTGELSIDLSAYILKTAIDTQAEFEALLFALPTGGAGGYVATPPTYSDEACTAGQYALSESYRYDCVSSGNWNRTALTDWSNPTPSGDGTPNAFTFTDVTNATVSTQYTALAQITGIDVGITCSASGGTVAACTGATEGTCGTFGATSGSLTNNQYVGARVTSSSSNSTAVNNVVTCGGVSDTFTVTTIAGGIACTGTNTFLRGSNASGDTEDFEFGADDYCSNNWIVPAATTGLNPYSTGYAKFGTHSMALTDDTGTTAGRVYVDHTTAQTSQYYRAYIKVPTLASGGNFIMFGVSRYGTSLGMPVSIYNSSGYKIRLSGSTTEYVPVTTGSEYRVELRADDADGSGTGTVKLYLRVFDSSGNAIETTNGGGDTELYVDSGVSMFQFFMFEPGYNNATAATAYVDGVKNCNTWCGGE